MKHAVAVGVTLALMIGNSEGAIVDTATEMYLYGWTLVMSSITRDSMWYLPDNLMLPLPVFPDPNLTAIVKPNVDTLYDACWINHAKAHELTLTVPDTTDGLYFLFPLMDAWTNVVDSPGWRTTGKGETKVLIRGPSASSSADNDDDAFDLVMESPTTMMYLLGRTNVANQSDLQPTQEQLFQYRLIPDSNSKSRTAVTDEDDDDNPVKTIFSMTPSDYFNTFAELMVSNPPVMPQDKDIVSRMETEYGLIPGQPWDYSSLSEAQQNELSQGLSKGIDMMYSYPVKRVNGWTIPNMKTGKYGTDYYLRAYIGLVLYAASLPEDTVYFETEMFTGGGKEYEILFASSASTTNGAPPPLPPTNEFWSITMYSEAGYLVPNANNTYSISSQQNLQFRADGSLHITISINRPSFDNDPNNATNWLPAPQDGDNFQLTLRVFWPGDDILSGDWIPPVVTEIQ